MRQNRRNVLKLGLSGAVAGWTGSLAGTASAQGVITARIGHLEAPTQPRHKGLEKVAALVKERTKGAVEIQLFPSSQLGNARQMIESTQFGAIEGTVMPAAFLGGFNPVISVLDIPYVFPTDRALSQKLREGAFGKALLASFASRGVHALTIWPNGRKSLTSNKPLANLDAFKGQKFRVMDFEDPDRPVCRGRRDRDRDQLQRALYLAADRSDRRTGKSARHHHHHEIPRGAEASSRHRAWRDGRHRAVQQHVLEPSDA